MMELQSIYKTGISAVHRSAGVLRSYLENMPRVNKKGAIDLVTQADIESEQLIIDTIRSQFPDHAILAEESGLIQSESSSCQWIIDPLD